MRKIILTFILILLINTNVFADDVTEIDNIYEPFETETAINSSNEPKTQSRNIIVLDRKTQLPLYDKDAFSKVPMASTTKILTCIIALETCSLNEIIPISKKAALVSGSTLGITQKTKINMNDLLYGLMLRSGNDCAIAIAEYISGTTENFSILMNKKAKEIGLKNSNFVTPHGLDDPNHYTTAYDLAILTNYALNNKKFLEIVSSKNYTIYLNNSPHTISNTNELLGNTQGVYGVKTGFTFEAGRCLVSACKRNNLDIIIVVLGADTKRIRTADSIILINYIFKNYNYINVKKTVEKAFSDYLPIFKETYISEKTNNIPILELDNLTNYDFPLSDTECLKLHTQIYTIESFNSDIKPGTIVGKLYLYRDNDILCSIDILLKNKLSKNNWKYYFLKILSLYKV